MAGISRGRTPTLLFASEAPAWCVNEPEMAEGQIRCHRPRFWAEGRLNA